LKSKVERVNHASCQLFAQSQEKLSNHHAAQLIPGFNFQRWLDSNPQNTHSEHVVINGQNFLMEITPVYLKGEGNTRVLTGAVIMLRSTLRMGRQLQNLSSQDVGAFSQIIAVSPKMRHVVDQARKLASLTAPLLITGDTGTGKDLLAHAVHLASPRAAKPYLALNCASIRKMPLKASCLATRRKARKGSSSRLTAAPCCWTRSAKCRRVCRLSCCVS
jgi:transcriptional regulator of aroF, aroG, tyrA and aromatic amino acid transport